MAKAYARSGAPSIMLMGGPSIICVDSVFSISFYVDSEVYNR